MKMAKNKLSALLALILFPAFVAGVAMSDFIWARLAKRDGKFGVLRLFEVPRHSAEAGGGSTTSGDCFPRGTLVAMAGFFGKYVTKRIEDIRKGDRVLAMDFPSGKLRRIMVNESIRWDSPAHPFVEVLFESGAKLVSTSIHPYVVNDKNETRRAWKLRPGDKVLLLEKERRWETVVELRSFERKEPVYNLELAGGPHNYFASADGLRFALVHNLKKDGDDTSTSACDGSSNCGPGCFRAGTLVAIRILPGGAFDTKPIEDIRPGDEVLSVALPATGQGTVSCKVVKVSRHASDRWQLVEFLTESGAKIVATDNHPMIVDESNIGVMAGNVAAGAKLFVAASPARWELVSEARKFTDTAEVYNIELAEGPHNYFVSLNGKNFVLVHNDVKD